MFEKILYEDPYCLIFTVTPEIPGPYRSDWPVRFIHFTYSMRDVESIVQNGFNLKKFGRTAKKFGAKKYLWEFDPRGVYANIYFEGSEIYAPRPYVVFDAPIHRALMFTHKDPSGDCGKKAIAALFGATGAQLQKKLLQNGIDAVSSIGGEQIILDPTSIEIVKWGDSRHGVQTESNPADDQDDDWFIRYTRSDGTGLMHRSAFNMDLLDDDEDQELTELLNYGLRQPIDVPQNAVFAFTRDGVAKNQRLLELLTKAAEYDVEEQWLDPNDYEVLWESDDGQVALLPLEEE